VSCPGRSLPPGKTPCPLYRRLGGLQGRSGQVRNISPPPGFDPRTVQPVASRYNGPQQYSIMNIFSAAVTTRRTGNTISPLDFLLTIEELTLVLSWLHITIRVTVLQSNE